MDIQTLIQGILDFLSGPLITLLFGLAFLFFIVNLFRYFILESDSEDGREKARRQAIWGIFAFVFLVSLWGIINVFIITFGFNTQTSPITPDYIGDRASPSTTNSPDAATCSSECVNGLRCVSPGSSGNAPVYEPC